MPKRILVVDDDPGIGDVLQLLLEEAGYDVEIQEDGHSVFRSSCFQLIKTRVRSPGMLGRMIFSPNRSRWERY